jgi:phosphoglycerol transferase MdoB-like AlkP superfamily enzyme
LSFQDFRDLEMSSTLPSTHLLRRYVLFALTVVFLLTMLRAIYTLWNFTAVVESEALITVFLQGLRFDLALVGALLFVPMVFFTLLSMFKLTHGLARGLAVVWLTLAMLFVLVVEFVTPYFMGTAGIRPGLAEWGSVPTTIDTMLELPRQHPIPAVLGGLLCLLVVVAFWQRLETRRLLRFPITKGGGALMMLLGGVACIVAIWSGPVIGTKPLSVNDLDVSTNATVNELTINSGFKLLSTLSEDLAGSLLNAQPAAQ